MRFERRTISRRLLLLLLSASFFLSACGQNDTLETILASGVIRVMTRNNAHCYYTYRGQEMGLEYDLAKAFADFLGVELDLAVAKSTDRLLHSLRKGQTDVGAASMTITRPRSKIADFSRPYLKVEQTIVTHRKHSRLKNVKDLAGKTVYVRPRTAHENSLRALKRQGLPVKIKKSWNLNEEALIQAVAEGRINVIMVDSHVALLNRRYYPDIRIAFSLGEPQHIAWAVKKGEKTLLNKVNEFFEVMDQNGTIDEIYKRYNTNVDRFDPFDIKTFLERIETRLPQYENTIKQAAEAHDFDWRLIAALIYQESQFNPWAKSFAGAKGLMQLTEQAAREMGVANRLNPRESITGGVRYLKKLHDLYDNAEEPDRTLIALAAYNVGKAHIIDARRIAETKGLNPNKWSALEKTLPLLRRPQYYNQSTYGYCQGTQPVFHVREILTYYDILKRGAIEYQLDEEIEG